MNCIIARRGVRSAEKINDLAELPDLKDIRLVGRFLHYDCDGNFESLQYALYFNNAPTYTVDLPNMDDWQPFENYLTEKFKAAGVNPKLATGTLQAFSGEDTYVEEV